MNVLTKLANHSLFDADWYLRRNPDVARARMDPAYHYYNHGAYEGRRASPHFDEAFYASQITSPIEQQSLFLHYMLIGEAAGLKPVRTWNDEPWWWQMPRPAKVLSEPEIKEGTAWLSRMVSAPSVVVVVPVYNAPQAVDACLSSLSRNRLNIEKVVVINDASTDPAIANLLEIYAEDPWFHCENNATNLGFSGTVNKAMQRTGLADVVVLNADTEVTLGFVRRLRCVAYSDERIATVTPVSNNAGAFSVPEQGENPVPSQFGLQRFARVLTQSCLSAPLEVPTGHGFCLYIRRSAWAEVGEFDARAFPRGYGEENDFCMRALRKGWRNLMDPSTFIYHQRSASFGEGRQQLITMGRRIVDERYPDYTDRVKTVFGGPGLQLIRSQIGEIARFPDALAQQVKPRVLYVLAARTGGTPQTNEDLMQALGEHIECFVLHCDRITLTLQHYADGIYTDVAEHYLADPIQAMPHYSSEYDAVVAVWLYQWAIELVHVRHIAWHSLGLFQLTQTLGIPVVKSFHDFYSVCPTVKLLDNEQRYCAGQCTAGSGVCKHELWPEDAFNALKHQQIYPWRGQFDEVLETCDAFVTTTQFTKDLILRYYPNLSCKPFSVIPHGRFFNEWQQQALAPKEKESIRILVPGNISVAKGGALIAEWAMALPDNKVEFHVLGKVDGALNLPGTVVCHGEYVREQFSTFVDRVQPHVGAVLSIWPETWCHTLTELWACGLPVIGGPFGAVAERIQQSNAGWVLPAMTLDAFVQILGEIEQPSLWTEKVAAVHHWQQTIGSEENVESMASRYLEVYQGCVPIWTQSFAASSSGELFSD